MDQNNPQKPIGADRAAGPRDFDPGCVKRRFEDLQYGTLPEQTCDLYLPETGNGPFPLIIDLHGGAWCVGSKRQCNMECVLGALDHGYAILCVEYRLAPKTKFPEFLFDVKTAVRFARANAEKYMLDPARFIALGDSAGGHLALMTGFTAGRPEYEGEKYGYAGVSSEVQAVVDFFGPAVLNDKSAEWLKENGIMDVEYCGIGPQGATMMDKILPFISTDVDMLPLVSPIAYVHKDIPPVLIMHGEIDYIVPVQNSTLLAERIREVCGPERVDLRLFPDRTHEDRAFMTDETCDAVVEFLDRYMK